MGQISRKIMKNNEKNGKWNIIPNILTILIFIFSFLFVRITSRGDDLFHGALDWIVVFLYSIPFVLTVWIIYFLITYIVKNKKEKWIKVPIIFTFITIITLILTEKKVFYVWWLLIYFRVLTKGSILIGLIWITYDLIKKVLITKKNKKLK